MLVQGSIIFAAVLVALVWIFKKSFEGIIRKSVEKELIKYADEVKKETEIKLKDYEHILAIELAKLSSNLSVSSETYKLAAQHRYAILATTWKLFRDLNAKLNETYASNNNTLKASFSKELNDAFLNLYDDRIYFPKETFSELDKLFATTFRHSHAAISVKSFSDLEEAEGALGKLLDILRKEIGSG
jgi:hypothetical protein